MQIIQLIDGGEGYGVATVLRMILATFDRMQVVALHRGKFVKELESHRLLWAGDMPIASIKKTSTLGMLAQIFRATADWWRTAGEIANAIGSDDAILHCHSQFTTIIAAMIRLRRRPRTTRIVFHYHSKMSNRAWGLVQLLQVQLIGRLADAIVCVSKAVAEYWKKSRCNVVVLYNAIGPWNAQSDQDAVFDGESDRKAMLMAASLSLEKGQLLAVDALAILRDRGCDLELWIAGGPLDPAVNPFASILNERIQSHNLSDRVRLLGNVSNVRALARRAWVGLQLRVTPEPFGLWSLEAMDAGLPLVATRTGGTPELVRDKVDGLLLTPPVTSDDVAAAVWRIYHDQALHAQLSRNARERSSSFSIERFVGGLMQIYSQVGCTTITANSEAGVRVS